MTRRPAVRPRRQTAQSLLAHGAYDAIGQDLNGAQPSGRRRIACAWVMALVLGANLFTSSPARAGDEVAWRPIGPPPVAQYWGEPGWLISPSFTSDFVGPAEMRPWLGDGRSQPDPTRQVRPSGGLALAMLSAYLNLLATRRASQPNFERSALRASPKSDAQVALWTPGAAEIIAQIGRGAVIAGVSPGYLEAVALAESGLSSTARAPTSSAAGLFQFVDQTWLDAVGRYGWFVGLGQVAALIEFNANGRAVVRDPGTRIRILAMRYDPLTSSVIAGAITRENAANLGAALGRPATRGELYAAHLLGSKDAVVLVGAARRAPDYPASRLFPLAAWCNPNLFYAGGVPRSVRDLVLLLEMRVVASWAPTAE